MSRYRMSTKEYHWYGEFVWTFTDRQGPRGSTTSARTTPVSTPRIVILSSTVRCEKRIFVQAGCSSMCGSKGACHGGGTSACICNGWSPDETCKCVLCPPRSDTLNQPIWNSFWNWLCLANARNILQRFYDRNGQLHTISIFLVGGTVSQVWSISSDMTRFDWFHQIWNEDPHDICIFWLKISLWIYYRKWQLGFYHMEF